MTRLQRVYLWIFTKFNALPEFIQIATFGALGALCYLVKKQLEGGTFNIAEYVAIGIAYIGNILGYYGKLFLEKKLQIEKLQGIKNQEMMGR